MSKNRLYLLTNIPKIFDELETISHFEESFTKEYISADENHIKKLFAEKEFILTIVNGDVKFSKSYFNTFVRVLKETNFPALILSSKANIKKYYDYFPVTADFMLKPASLFEIHYRVNRIVQIYIMKKKLDLLKGLEDEIDIRDRVMEMSRKELIDGSETIKALDIAMEMSRQELIKQKEEIKAREQTLELIRKDRIDLLSHIRAFEAALRVAGDEKAFYKKEIEALENLLVFIIQNRQK